MKEKVSIAVVIPFIRETLSKSETISLDLWQQHLAHFDTYVVSPPGVKSPNSKIKTCSFPAEHFSSVRSYSELLLTEKFYQTFNQYDYILIYQLDALVFSDDLTPWTSKNISYVGAPWSKTIIGSLTSPTTDLRGGNGGLSLRSVAESIKVIQATNTEAKFNFKPRWKQWAWFLMNTVLGQTKQKWLACPADQYPFNEDGFWSFEASKYSSTFKPAAQQDSLGFAFETEPRKCFELSHQVLPFGAHAWEKYDKAFWLEKFGFLS